MFGIARSFRVARALTLLVVPLLGCGSSSSGDDNNQGDAADSGPPVDTSPSDTNTLPFTPLTKVTAPGCAADPATTQMAAIHPTDATKQFCIDVTEVTVAQYQAFLDATSQGVVVDGQPKGCAFNDTYKTAAPPSDTTLPMTDVDWCDAYMYCLYAGKHLCGEFGGGPVQVENIASTDHDEWFFACTEGDPSTHPYPYGATWTAGTCLDNQGGAPQAKAPMSMPGCKGDTAPYDSLFDMSGNVQEWQDACVGTDVISQCHVRGGSAVSSGVGGGSGCGANASVPRNSHDALTGFRCCADK